MNGLTPNFALLCGLSGWAPREYTILSLTGGPRAVECAQAVQEAIGHLRHS